MKKKKKKSSLKSKRLWELNIFTERFPEMFKKNNIQSLCKMICLCLVLIGLFCFVLFVMLCVFHDNTFLRSSRWKMKTTCKNDFKKKERNACHKIPQESQFQFFSWPLTLTYGSTFLNHTFTLTLWKQTKTNKLLFFLNNNNKTMNTS